MAKFCFYIGDDQNLLKRLRSSTRFCWRSVEELTLDTFHLFIAKDDLKRSLYLTHESLGAICGYAKSPFISDRLGGFFSEIIGQGWPLRRDWTGSFAAAAYSSVNGEVILCNDLLGHFPLYYSQAGGGFVGGTSLIAMGRALGCETDVVGVLQRITVPFCNYGTRTLLKQVFRLLPGERLKWTSNPPGFQREYDNTLFQTIAEMDLPTTARQVFDHLRGEVVAAIEHEEEISVAMSGGWDSRLVLGGIPSDRFDIHCLTYGGEDLYETRIARRCADAVGASHECFPIDEKYFPSRRQIEMLVRETESANYFEWVGIIEKARAESRRKLLLLGDLCESIDGRYITDYSSRKARIESFLGGLVGRREVFEESNAPAFRRWCDKKTIEITSQLLSSRRHLSADLSESLAEEQIVAEIRSDLSVSFGRVIAHAPPFSATYDELFIWFHRIRFLLGNQISWLGSAFYPVSPGISMGFLRLITTIHPKHRIRRRLMNAISDLPEFDKLSRIPSSQVPFLSGRSPAFIRDLVWGIRSGVDQLMINRTLRLKKFDGRQRILRSLDYVKEYRGQGTVENVKGWFSGTHLKADNYLRLLHQRAELEAWTMINVDIAAPANVAMILDLCGSEPQQGNFFERRNVASVCS